jgi:hypothetical protein
MRLKIVLLLGFLPLLNIAQETKKENSLSFYGFVRNDFYLDTYKGVNSFQDLFYLYPNYIGVDANGNDINEQTSANLLSVVTRMGVNITGPEILGAKTTGCIEVDFAGKPEIYLIRMRKAYMQLTWKKSQLLVGQTWHPFFGGANFPFIPSLNTGAPFHPFNRSPQVRYDYKIGALTLTATALYQQQYVSCGPVGSSNIYKRDAVLPESVASFEYSKNGYVLGGGLDYNSIKPRVSTTGSDGKIYNTDEILGSLSYMVYGKYSNKKLLLLAKSFYGQNMVHMTMNGGYGVADYDVVTGKETYTNYNGSYSIFNFYYGSKWRPGIYVGYYKNLGTSDPLYNFTTGGKETATVWGLGQTIQDMYRISPSLTYLVPKFQVGLEYELTTANYGVGPMDFNNGLIDVVHKTTNNGVRLVATYYF